jgi:hypothetical protein
MILTTKRSSEDGYNLADDGGDPPMTGISCTEVRYSETGVLQERTQPQLYPKTTI